jgi:hypothetical protein
MFGKDFLRFARKNIKMIALAIINGMLANELIIEFVYEGELIEVFYHRKADSSLTLILHRDGVSAYSLCGTSSIESIKQMASDIFFLLSVETIKISI